MHLVLYYVLDYKCNFLTAIHAPPANLPIVLLRRIGETKCIIMDKYLLFVFDPVPILCFKLYLQVLPFSNGISINFFFNCFSNSRNVQDV